MIEVKGKNYLRITEVAKRYGVVPNTVRTWIRTKIVPKPPYARQGRKYIPYFPEDLLTRWDRVLEPKEEI